MHFIYAHGHQAQNFLQINCFGFANVMNNTIIINTFNSDNSNIANVKTEHHQIITTITNMILKSKPMIKEPIMAGNKLFAVITFSRINSFNSFYHNVTFLRPIYQNQKTNLYQFQKDCHVDNLSFACLQFYKHNCLNICVCR